MTFKFKYNGVHYGGAIHVETFNVSSMDGVPTLTEFPTGADGAGKLDLLLRGGLPRHEGIAVPDGFSFDGLPGLSNELQERLRQVRPTSLGQASRIPGMTPAAVGLLAAALDRRRKGLS